MNFNEFFLKSFRILLFPLACLYGLVIIVRNWMYRKGWLQSAKFSFPIICVGNLSVGGTGKSPFVEYLLRLLHREFKVATLSRGYKRKTKGYTLAGLKTTALDIGDEPMQFHKKFSDVAVAVGEDRYVAITQMLQDLPRLEAIILDDAFQHRSVVAGLNILLTDYSDLYPADFFLPTGNLRDEWSSARRAQIIVVTKCPPNLDLEEKVRLRKLINPLAYQKLYFTCIKYGTPYHILDAGNEWNLTTQDEVLLVTGIANPEPLKEYLHENAQTYYQKSYRDHHIFTIDDLEEILEQFKEITTGRKIILTTEKDAVRLEKFAQQLANIPLYVIPIQHRFLFGEGYQFNEQIIRYIEEHKNPFQPHGKEESETKKEKA